MDQSVSAPLGILGLMTAFPEDRLLRQVVLALENLGGTATVDEITGQLSRSGAIQLPHDALQTIVLMTLRSNRDGRGMGCFAQRPGPAYGLVVRADRPEPPVPAPRSPIPRPEPDSRAP